MSTSKIFSHYRLGETELKNRIVMAPMTRSRATGNIPNELMAKYYTQRSGAGLIITEGISPSPNGLGYPRIPGLFSAKQVKGWQHVTQAVHTAGGKIFAQLMHTGRIGHSLNLPAGAEVLAPSAIKANEQMYTDQEGVKELPVPKAMTLDDVRNTKNEYVVAAQNAIEAGFHGIELHSANGYLLEQFIHPGTNHRTDEYGGSVENRTRFVLEVARETAIAIDKERVGIRVSPYGVFNDMSLYEEIEKTYVYLAEKLNEIGIAYIHIVDHSSMGAPEVPASIKEKIRSVFNGTLILSGGYDKDRAEADLEAGKCDLVAFGKPFIANPDLVYRFEHSLPLNQDLRFNLFYTPGSEGYTDYPTYETQKANV